MFLSHVVACGQSHGLQRPSLMENPCCGCELTRELAACAGWYQIGYQDQVVLTADGAYTVNVRGWVSGQFLPTYGCGGDNNPPRRVGTARSHSPSFTLIHPHSPSFALPSTACSTRR